MLTAKLLKRAGNREIEMAIRKEVDSLMEFLDVELELESGLEIDQPVYKVVCAEQRNDTGYKVSWDLSVTFSYYQYETEDTLIMDINDQIDVKEAIIDWAMTQGFRQIEGSEQLIKTIKDQHA
jgi:hypothetical protein